MTHDDAKNDTPKQDNTSDDDASPDRNGMTPRQMWQARQREARGETEKKLNVQPIKDSEEPNADQSDPPESREVSQKASGDTDDGPDDGHEKDLDDASDEPNTTDLSSETTEETADESPSTTQADNEEQEQMKQELSENNGDNADYDADEGVRMVDNEKQPGMMQYPYATHGPPPDDDGDGGGWEEKMVPSSFVLGILVIIGGLLIGLALVAQQRRLNRLEDRLKSHDKAISELLDRNE